MRHGWATGWLLVLVWTAPCVAQTSAAPLLNSTAEGERYVHTHLQCGTNPVPNLNLVFAFSNVHPFSAPGLVGRFPEAEVRDGHVVHLQGQKVRAFKVPGRPWQLQVLNTTTMGFLQTFTDTLLDHLTNDGRYCFLQMGGRLTCVSIPGTHDAHFNTASQTLFYLRASRRPAETACPPFYKVNDTLLVEIIVEASPTGETLWTLPLEAVL